MNVTRTLTMIRSGNATAAIRARITRMIDDMTAAAFTWLISKPAVQEAIVAQFENQSTPMCGALSRAVASAVSDVVEGMSVDADNVSGLERYIEHAFEQLNAGDIKDFDAAVEEVVKKGALDGMVEDVISELRDRLRG